MSDVVEIVARALPATIANGAYARRVIEALDAAGYAVVRKEGCQEIWNALGDAIESEGYDLVHKDEASMDRIFSAALSAAPKVTK